MKYLDHNNYIFDNKTVCLYDTQSYYQKYNLFEHLRI